MATPLFQVCRQDQGVTALLGIDPLRLYPFAAPTEAVELPYATYRVISGTPQNFLAERPDVDTYRLQLDAYAQTADIASSVSSALSQAIEPHASIVSYGDETIDKDTGYYRSRFEVSWLVYR